MENVRSLWPAVWVSGNEIHIEHNWVGLQDAAMARAWLPASVSGDLPPREPSPSQTAADCRGGGRRHPSCRSPRAASRSPARRGTSS